MEEAMISKKTALKILEELAKFNRGLEEGVDDKITKLEKYIQQGSDLSDYTYDELRTTAPPGVYSRTGRDTYELAVVASELGRVVLYLSGDRGTIIPADRSWEKLTFHKLHDVELRVVVANRDSTTDQNGS